MGAVETWYYSRLNGTILPAETPQSNKMALLFMHLSFLCLLDLEPQRQYTLGVLDNLVTTQLALAIHTINEGDGNLSNRAAHSLGANHHLHLEGISLAFGARNHLLQHTLLIQTEAARQVAHTRSQHGIREEIGSTAHKLALQVPAEHTAVASISGARDDVVVALRLDCDHLGDELGVVAEVGVHDDDEVAGDELQAVDVGGAEAKFARSGLEDDVGSVSFDKLEGDFLGAIGGTVVDDDEFPVEFAAVLLV